MMGRQRIYSVSTRPFTKEERMSVCVVLLEKGYTVRCGREKVASKSAYRYYIEYWKEDG